RERVQRSGSDLVQAGPFAGQVQRDQLLGGHRAGAAHHDQARDQGLEAARGLGVAERLAGEDRAEEPAPSVDADEPRRAVAGAAVGPLDGQAGDQLGAEGAGAGLRGAALRDDGVAQRAAHVLPQPSGLRGRERMDLERGAAQDEVRAGDRTAALVDLHPQLHAVDGGHLQPAQVDAVLVGGVGLVVGAVLEVLAAGRLLGVLSVGLLGRVVVLRRTLLVVVLVRGVELVAGVELLGLAGLLGLSALPAGEESHDQPSVLSWAPLGPALPPNPPLEPNPASARAVASRSSTSSSRGARNGTTTSWAMRSPTRTVKGSLGSVLCRATLTGPR